LKKALLKRIRVIKEIASRFSSRLFCLHGRKR
jgi:hypothetical protein